MLASTPDPKRIVALKIPVMRFFTVASLVLLSVDERDCSIELLVREEFGYLVGDLDIVQV